MTHHILLPNPIDDLTFDEWHSALGGLIGFYLGRTNHPRVAAGLALAALLGVKTGPVGRSSGWESATGEPWYFSTMLLVAYLLGEATRP